MIIQRKAVFGMIDRRERWSFTGRGWLVMAVCALAASYAIASNIYGFLAETVRCKGGVLVVEGWIGGYAMKGAAVEFRNGAYARVFTTGGPAAGSGGYTNDFCTAASVGAEGLIKAGVPKECVQVVPSRWNDRDRTYSSAMALNSWIRAHKIIVSGLNVVTEAPHARRTRLLYQKAFGDDVLIGVIGIQNPDYEPQHWWRCSDGVRDVLGESIAYIYARFLFYPKARETKSSDVLDRKLESEHGFLALEPVGYKVRCVVDERNVRQEFWE